MFSLLWQQIERVRPLVLQTSQEGNWVICWADKFGVWGLSGEQIVRNAWAF